jgi:LAO/AO transport system kinase
MNSSTENWAAQIRAGDVRAISRAVSAVESGDPASRLLLRELFPATGRAWRIGITGAAGTGKSTLAGALAAQYRAQGKSVGVIAVDPSSPFTGGAILGDRIRMHRHEGDDGVFIRSMAARGASGGLAEAAADAALLLDAAGKDVILLETVGVGQAEIEVVRVADCTLVVVMPGAGDEVQSLKAGLMEIADIFVLNKADREGADRFEEELLGVMQLAPPRTAWTPQIVRTVATEGQGIDELARAIDAFRKQSDAAGARREREIAFWKSWLLRFVQQRVIERISSQSAQSGAKSVDREALAIASREKDPYAAAEEMLASIGLTHEPRR